MQKAGQQERIEGLVEQAAVGKAGANIRQVLVMKCNDLQKEGQAFGQVK